MSELSKTEMVMAALKGETVDRVPVSAWWHDWGREWSAVGVAEATLEAYRHYDWDYVKVNPRFTYYGEDWGTAYERFPDRGPVVRTRAVESVDDLNRLKSVSGTTGAYGEQIEALRLIGKEIGSESTFIQTVFTPLAVMVVMTGSPKFVRKLMAEHPSELSGALGQIERTLSEYSAACLEAGASGIFLASVDWGTNDNISWEEYEHFGKPHDQRILDAVKGAPFNVFHVCRDRNLLPQLLDYPVAAFHCDARGVKNLSLADALGKTGKAVIGGVRQGTILSGSPDDVRSEAMSAVNDTGGRRFLLAPGCSIDPTTPEANLRALVEAAR